MGEGVKKILVLAEQWYKVSAEANNPFAQLNLAMLYELSTNEEKLNKSFYWYEKASLQGVIIAQNNLGKMYYIWKRYKS